MTSPRLSVIVIAYDMAAQALNTLKSLAPGYQNGIAADDYEVIVVENRSSHCMDAAAIAALPGNFRYLLRENDSVSPARAINEALAEARGSMIGIMIDGARMVTPGVLRFALMAHQISPMAVVAVPGYQLGPEPQHVNTSRSFAQDIEALSSIDWPAKGYKLFSIASISQANRTGFLTPFMESNCLFAPTTLLRDMGGAEERFDLPGGGALNLYLYHKLVNHPETVYFVLPGEGSFHQVHGGVTTSARAGREDFLAQILTQLNTILGEPFKSPKCSPILLGTLPGPVHPFLKISTESFIKRTLRLERGIEDPELSGQHQIFQDLHSR